MTMKLLDCVLIGVCVVIRSNTVVLHDTFYVDLIHLEDFQPLFTKETTLVTSNLLSCTPSPF